MPPDLLLAIMLAVSPSAHAKSDFPLTADPSSSAWKHAPSLIMANDPYGSPVPGHRTEIRTRWTGRNLYVLFICPYDKLYLKPDPVTGSETNKLWDWDVAELFIGSDFDNITRYKEFEISPQGEWVDLDIDRKHPLPGGGISWNSGFHFKTRIDEPHKIWYGEMQIPFEAISSVAPQPGQKFRVNFYRIEGPPPDRLELSWQPTHSRSFHVPESFGTLELTR